MATDREIRYYQNQYENLRRKSNKEIERLNNKIHNMRVEEFRFANKVYDLCSRFGMTDEEIRHCFMKGEKDGTK